MLPDVFIVSDGIAKCVREIIRGSLMFHYLTTNKLIYRLPDDFGSSYADVVLHWLSTNILDVSHEWSQKILIALTFTLAVKTLPWET